MDFLPELQLNWYLDELRVARGDRAVIRVRASQPTGFPNPHGRGVRDTLSWPEVWVDQATAEFRFENIYVLRISEEESESEIKEPVFEGTTFRRYSDSHLLREQRAFRPELEHEFMHFRLTFQDERIDVICTRPPEISLNRLPTGPFLA